MVEDLGIRLYSTNHYLEDWSPTTSYSQFGISIKYLFLSVNSVGTSNLIYKNKINYKKAIKF